MEESHEDVFMKLFVQSFTNDVAEWYIGLPDGSIPSCHEFIDLFIEKFEDHSDLSFTSHELTNIRKQFNELVVELI